MVKVLAVGGAGDMGRVGAETIALEGVVDSVVIADLDGGRARDVAASIGPKASAIELDITDTAALDAALSEVDLVLNTVGPFFRFGPPVLEAAIRTRTDYADIMDDWQPTVEMLGLDDAAREVGITALIGMGASPGVSNMLAAKAMQQLDEATSLHTVWRAGVGIPKAPAEGEDYEPAAAIDHWIHNLAYPILVWQDGRYQEIPPRQQVEINYPGFGPAPTWMCGHPEPITLPRTYPGLIESYNLMTSRPGLMKVAGEISERVAAGELSIRDAGRELIFAPGRRGPEAGEAPDLPGVFVLASGTRDGVPTRVAVSTNVLPGGSMGASTSIPLAVGAAMIARGEVTRHGVFAPEGILDPDLFFDRLAAFVDTDLPPLEVQVERA
jgi:saccharopine dehydrogenase-like NADP-dependent oxidoreductase